jgi:hypothetical protein
VKAQAIAHTMEGLVKYHGLRDWDLRIPYHDSISVNLQAFTATTEVRFGNFGRDEAYIDGKPVTGRELERILTVINYIRRLAGIEDNFFMSSQNSIPKGAVKGLGFSSAGGAALAAAAYKAAGLDKDIWLEPEADFKNCQKTRGLCMQVCRRILLKMVCRQFRRRLIRRVLRRQQISRDQSRRRAVLC